MEKVTNEKIIKLESISKSYKTKTQTVNALTNINLDFSNGKFYAIQGHSGSGKSTLINILGLIDKMNEGSYELYGNDTKNLTDEKMSYLRMKNIGFIFQDFNLNQTLKAYENVMVPMIINKDIKPKERKERATKLLESVGLKERINHYPKELSGGEQQRVSIARALANDPSIILADEPTGNLDKENEAKIFETLKQLSKEGKCIIVVSHSDEVKKYADKIINIESGKLIGDKK